MISFIKALFFALVHPYDVVHFIVVRRYVDAQNRFIGELYMGEYTQAVMIGMSCDSLPFDVGRSPERYARCRFDCRKDFLEPMDVGVLRVGGVEPSTNEAVRQIVSLRRFCPVRVTVLNRFIEHVLEAKHV